MLGSWKPCRGAYSFHAFLPDVCTTHSSTCSSEKQEAVDTFPARGQRMEAPSTPVNAGGYSDLLTLPPL